MGWASSYITALQSGQTVSFRPRGNSMVPKIESGQLCTLKPLDRDPEKGDIVLCKVNGNEFLHLVSAVHGAQFQISNNHGFVNGWTTRNRIYGVLINIEP